MTNKSRLKKRVSNKFKLEKYIVTLPTFIDYILPKWSRFVDQFLDEFLEKNIMNNKIYNKMDNKRF